MLGSRPATRLGTWCYGATEPARDGRPSLAYLRPIGGCGEGASLMDISQGACGPRCARWQVRQVHALVERSPLFVAHCSSPPIEARNLSIRSQMKGEK